MRRRLIVVAAAVASLTVIAFIVPLGFVVRQLANDRALSGAERDAQLIAVQVAAAGAEPATLRSIVGNGTINGNDLTVVLTDRTLYGAPLRPGEVVDPAAVTTAERRWAAGGIAVYAPAFGAAGGTLVVRVFVADSELDRGIGAAYLVLGVLGLGLIIIAVVIADWLARSFVRPIERLSAAASSLGGGDLSTRVVPEGPPEILEVGTQFNRLAERMIRLLEVERETAADLSHRLRTPMAALRLDAERLESGSIKERVLDDLSELERVIDYVIREVRRPGRTSRVTATDLRQVVEERSKYWEALADEQRRHAAVVIPDGEPILVGVPAEDLEAAVDALIGNVFAHTPETTGYTVTCAGVTGAGMVIVDDAGAGFGFEALRRGHSGGGSTGLGLDIARRTAEDSGGSLTISISPQGGARVILELRQAPQA
ncbi:MAG: HAMP domain-containing histidine kinase [Actinomycetota bacterium]|nr:HAMP domain-containing histidine kinase [Actinomycetota bacterium]